MTRIYRRRSRFFMEGGGWVINSQQHNVSNYIVTIQTLYSCFKLFHNYIGIIQIESLYYQGLICLSIFSPSSHYILKCFSNIHIIQTQLSRIRMLIEKKNQKTNSTVEIIFEIPYIFSGEDPFWLRYFLVFFRKNGKS